MNIHTYIHTYMNRPITAPDLERSYNVYMSMKVLCRMMSSANGRSPIQLCVGDVVCPGHVQGFAQQVGVSSADSRCTSAVQLGSRLLLRKIEHSTVALNTGLSVAAAPRFPYSPQFVSCFICTCTPHHKILLG